MGIDVSRGSVADLGKDGVVVSESVAKQHAWSVGDTIPAEFAASGEQQLHVVGVCTTARAGSVTTTS